MTRSLGHQGRVDANQEAIVDALRRVGCSVQSLARLGNGAPDLMAARAGKLYLIEIKTDGGTLTVPQIEWKKTWNSEVHTVRSIEAALATVGLMPGPSRRTCPAPADTPATPDTCRGPGSRRTAGRA